MRWKVVNPLDLLPKDGESKIEREFFWLPTEIDGTVYWLELRTVKWRYYYGRYLYKWCRDSVLD